MSFEQTDFATVELRYLAHMEKLDFYRMAYGARPCGLKRADAVWAARDAYAPFANSNRLSRYYAKQDLAFLAGALWESASTGRLRIAKPSPSIAAVQQKERQMKRDETILTISLLCACALMTVALIWRLSVMP